MAIYNLFEQFICGYSFDSESIYIEDPVDDILNQSRINNEDKRLKFWCAQFFNFCEISLKQFRSLCQKLWCYHNGELKKDQSEGERLK